LEPYDFEIKNITNGDQLVEWAKKKRPTLMMVSVEPKKIGYAICNKLKRNAELKDVPLILTSGEESPEKFEQHKTFKLRDDDYMFKPLNRQELMRKVNVLIGLDEPDASGVPSPSAEIFLGTDVVSSEIAIDADDIVDETKTATPPPQPVAARVSDTHDSMGATPVLDSLFDQAAEDAFDALDIFTPAPQKVAEELNWARSQLLGVFVGKRRREEARNRTAAEARIEGLEQAWKRAEEDRRAAEVRLMNVERNGRDAGAKRREAEVRLEEVEKARLKEEAERKKFEAQLQVVEKERREEETKRRDIEAKLEGTEKERQGNAKDLESTHAKLAEMESLQKREAEAKNSAQAKATQLEGWQGRPRFVGR
jgi:hypothetical protein